MLCGQEDYRRINQAMQQAFRFQPHLEILEMLWISCPDSSLAPAVAATRAAFRRWLLLRWRRLNRDRIALAACDPRELSESGRRLRAETLREMRERQRSLD